MKVSVRRSETLDLFLALQRDLTGRFAWDISFLPRPVVPEIAQFQDGIRAWREGGLDSLPAWITTLDEHHSDDERILRGTKHISQAITAAAPRLRAALTELEPLRTEAIEVLERGLRLSEIDDKIRTALGVRSTDLTLPLYLAPLAPYPPALGFLAGSTELAGAYVDCRRFRSSTLVESVLTMLGWALLTTFPCERSLSAEVARRIPGDGPYHRRRRAVLTKILLELTIGGLVRETDPTHRPCVHVLGTAWRYPRLYAVAERHWNRYLAGLADRDDALRDIADDLLPYSPRWHVNHVDAAALAADFYLLEWLAAEGDVAAARRLAHWLPRLTGDLADQLDLIIGAELGHYERARDEEIPKPLAEFLRQVTTGDSRAAWPRVRSALGQARGLQLAEQAFSGPGIEYGGEAWAPVAAMMRRFVTGELPQQVFVDQCFTLQHNNGSLFDKFFDTDDALTVLDAQAAGQFETLAAHASPEVRCRWYRQQRLLHADHDPSWLGLPAEPPDGAGADIDDEPGWAGLSVWEALPGTLGCGSSQEASRFAAEQEADRVDKVRLRRPIVRRPPPGLPEYHNGANATLDTSLGRIELRLWPRLTPYTVDNFVSLAKGTRRAVGGEPYEGGYYDGTVFHRRIPGFLIQGGDRSGTGEGGPGYRIRDELRPELVFDLPFRVAMANTGRDSTGSQFFITLAPSKHLNGAFTQFGAVEDPASQEVALAIAESADPVLLHTVRVRTW